MGVQAIIFRIFPKRRLALYRFTGDCAGMILSSSYGLIAVASLLPATLIAHRSETRAGTAPDLSYWAALAIAVLGPGVWAMVQLSGHWHAGLGSALWVSVAATMALFAMLSWSVREAWRLTPLLAPYMLLMGAVAVLAPVDTRFMSASPGVDSWLISHIFVSVITYALVTVAAVAALAAFMQDRSLKTKRPTKLTHKLPSVADCEFLSVRLLGWGEGILGLDLLTGMGAEYKVTGQMLRFDHKTVLSLSAFLVIGALLFTHHKTGMRGRKAARLVLLGYLLLSLGYLGVKVVTDVILA